MASEQVVRRDTADTVEEKEPVIEVTTVPGGATYMSFQKGRGEESKQRDDDEQEMATKDDPEYESLAERVKGMDVGQLKEKMASSIGIEGSESYEESEESMKKPKSLTEKFRAMDEGSEREVGTGESVRREESQLTLQEISKLRALAQQNSMEMLRAAEEKYNQAKEKANQGLDMDTEKAAEAKGKAADGSQVMKEFAADKGSQVAQKAAEMSGKVAEGAQVAKEYAAEKGGQAAQKALEAKDKVDEGALAAKEYATETGSQAAQKAVEAKDKAVGRTYSTAHYAAEKGAAAKDMVLEKGQQGLANTKDTIVSAAIMAKDYTVPKVVEAKDKTMEVTKGVVGYAGEKAGESKEKTVETGKHAAEYARKVATDMKDKAVVVGWEAAHYTTEKAVEGAKVAVGVIQGVAGKAGEIAAKPLVAAKDMTAATAEKAKEYTAQKKEEAEREYEAKKHTEQQQTDGRGDISEHDQGVAVKAKEFVGGAEKARGTAQGNGDITPGAPSEQEMGQEGAGVLGAIGETLVGIAETTKQMVIGQDEPVEGKDARIPRSSSTGIGHSTEERKANQ